MRNGLRHAGFVLLIATGYVAAGKLGLLLAIPPGYASAIWPPSGIALGALLLLGNRYWAGVWLGSFLTNVGTDAFVPAAIIGMGAALQAVVGAALIRRFVGFPTELQREREIFSFFALGGPIACLINPCIGVATLLFLGKISMGAAAYSAWTWWVGDSIGVLIFAPLIVMWFGGERWQARRVAVTLSLVITFTAAVLVFVYTSRLEWQQMERRFRENAVDLATTIGRRLDLNIEMARATGALFAASDHVERDEFNEFADFMLNERIDLQAIQWAPRVLAADRKVFESRMIRTQAQKQWIFERRGQAPAMAHERSEYFPIDYIEPFTTNTSAYGYDLASDPTRWRALEHARATGQVTASAPVELVQTSATHDGFLIVLPVYSKTMPEKPTVAQRRDSLLGFVATVNSAHRMVGQAVADRHSSEHLRLRIEDSEFAGATKPLFQTTEPEPATARPAARQPEFTYRTTLNVAGRQWILTFTPTDQYLLQSDTVIAWMVLAAGLCFSALVGAGALALTGRTAAVEAQVWERTAELAETNERLAKADRVKSEFISTVSHELRTPLTSIRGSLGLLNGGAAGAVPDKALELIGIAYRNTDRLQRLINDILDVEKMDSGKLSLELAPHSLPALVMQAVEANTGYAQNCNVEFNITQPLPDSVVAVDPHRFLQVMANLLSNAAKFSPKGSAVEISVQTDAAKARVQVKDQGTGIPLEFQSRIFQRFSQADGSDARVRGGTGLGLAISKALIERMGGTIDYITAPGAGTMFFFDLPLVPAAA